MTMSRRRVAAWLASIRTAIHFLESAGCAHVSLVGLRVGATLAAAELSAGGGIAAAVLWDPYPTGRSFVRQQGMLARVIEDGHTRDDGSVEGPGIVMSPETVSDLKDLKPPIDPSVADRLLVLTRAGRSLPIDLQSSLQCESVDWREVEGQETLVDVEPVFARIPDQTLELIVGWLRDVLPGTEGPVLLPGPTGAIVGHAQDGQMILEHPVLLGPNRLFGIETTPGACRWTTLRSLSQCGADRPRGPGSDMGGDCPRVGRPGIPDGPIRPERRGGESPSPGR